MKKRNNNLRRTQYGWGKGVGGLGGGSRGVTSMFTFSTYLMCGKLPLAACRPIKATPNLSIIGQGLSGFHLVQNNLILLYNSIFSSNEKKCK